MYILESTGHFQNVFFHNIRVSYIHSSTHTGIFNRPVLVTYTNAHTHTEEYSKNDIRIFVMFPFSCISWYINLIFFVLLCFESSFVRVFHIVYFIYLFNDETTIHNGWTKHHNNSTSTPSKSQFCEIVSKEFLFANTYVTASIFI